MKSEREDFTNETEYGSLTMRSYDIDGNSIDAFYDADDDLVFVLDNTINQSKPNVLLVINPMGDKKWDEILAVEYDVDLETIRPKQDNKYQKLDIEYSGLSVYENLINAYVAGDDLAEHLNQLNILRDSAARHSAMTRLNAANDTISKTNVTIVKTKETIVRLQERIKTLRAKLSTQKKEIGKVPTKQSASKILKLEAQIEATTEKLKRAKKRLDSAQKRLEVATVDAELASDLLNQPALDIKQSSKPVMVAPKYEVQKIEDDEDDESADVYKDDFDDIEDDQDTYIDEEDDDVNADSDVKPLFDKDPNILNEDIAFKPISLDAPALSNLSTNAPEPIFNQEHITEASPVIEEDVPAFIPTNAPEQKPVLDSFTPLQDNSYTDVAEDPKPVLESMAPVEQFESIKEPTMEQPINIQPVVNTEPRNEQPVMPVPPIVPVNTAVATNSRSKPSFVYYLLLVILIALSVFTLWLYQKQMGTGEPMLAAAVTETATEEQKVVPEKEIVVNEEKVQPVKVEQEPEELIFEEDEEEVLEPEPDNVVEEPVQLEESVIENESASIIPEEPAADDFAEEPGEPVIMDAVPAQVMTSGGFVDENVQEENFDEVNVDKPEYDVGSKDDDIFISEQDYQNPQEEPTELDEEQFYDYEE